MSDTYKTGNNSRGIMMLEGRNTLRHTSHDRYTAKDTNQSPNSNQAIPHGRWRLGPISQEVGDRTRQPAPWWGRN